MRDPEDITIYNTKVQEQRLFQLLMAVDDRFDNIRREILKKEPLPTVEAAYSTIRREEARINILKRGPSDTSSGIG